jgi:hypothetical protein
LVKEPTALQEIKKMRDEELEAQRRSFAFGNCKLDNENITREMVEQESEKLKALGVPVEFLKAGGPMAARVRILCEIEKRQKPEIKDK